MIRYLVLLVTLVIIAMVLKAAMKRPEEPPRMNTPALASAKAAVPEEQPKGPLSFWNGEVIVGEGPDRGKIELMAAPGQKAVVLTADKDGVCSFESIKGIDEKLYIRIGKRGQAPALSASFFTVGEHERKMHGTYRASEALKEGKLTPLIMPSILPPAERLYREKGQFLTGYIWDIRSYDVQVYGHERKRDPSERYSSDSDDVEQTPLVKAKFKSFPVDLTPRYFSAEELVKMAEEDKKFDGQHDQKNYSKEFTSSLGTFRAVGCPGRYSVNKEAKNRGGMVMRALQLPNGKWIRDILSIERTFEADDTVYLICEHNVVKYGKDGSLECVVSFEGGGRWMPYICPLKTPNGLVVGKYCPVNKSSESQFGGLLEYREGKWLFHQYDGDYGTWAEKGERKDDQIVITLFNGHEDGPGKQVSFDPAQGTFKDL